MAEVTINYKDTAIATMDASGTKTLQTQGKYCEDDIEVVYARPSGGNRQYIIRDGVIQNGFTVQTVSPAVLTEQVGGYLNLAVDGNEYCIAYVNGLDFDGFHYIITDLYPIDNKTGWSWLSSYTPVISANTGNATIDDRNSGQPFDFINSNRDTSGSDITTLTSILDVSQLTDGHIKIAMSAVSKHPSAYLNIKNMYLLGD